MQKFSLARYITQEQALTGSVARFKKWTGVAVFAYGAIVALFVAAFVYHFHSLDGSTIDLDGFGLLSRNVAAGKGFTLGYGPTMRRAPLYPFLAAGILKIFGNYGVGVPDAIAYRPIVIAQCFVFGLTCLTAWALSRRLFGPRVALLTVVLCPLIPQSLRYITMTEVETLMGLWTVLLAFTSLTFVQRPRISTGIYLGLTVAAATLTKPVPQLYLVLFLPVVWWYWRTQRLRSSTPTAADFVSRRVLASVAALLFFALPLLPWTIRNWTVSDGKYFGVSSNAAAEFLRGYVNVEPKYFLLRQDYGGWDPEANDYETAILAAHGAVFYHEGPFANGTVFVSPSIPKGVSSIQLEVHKDKIETAAAEHLVLHDPLGFMRKFLIQLATFWYIAQTQKASLALGFSALLMLGLSAIGVVHAARRGVMTWPIVFVVVYFNVIYAAILAMGRYSMPLYPTLTILAAGGLAAVAPHVVGSLARRMPVLARLPELAAISSARRLGQVDGK